MGNKDFSWQQERAKSLMPSSPESQPAIEESGAEKQVRKTFSLCFIELQQMRNKLEKIGFIQTP